MDHRLGRPSMVIVKLRKSLCAADNVRFNAYAINLYDEVCCNNFTCLFNAHSFQSMAEPTMEVVFEGEREQNGMWVLLLMICVPCKAGWLNCRNVFFRASDKISAIVQTVQAFTAEQSDEAQRTTSLLSVEASGVPEFRMSITLPISMSMRGEKQRRVGILTGGIAGGIIVLTFASMIVVLCYKTLQKRRNGQAGNRYRAKDHEVDIDDYDDIEGEWFSDSRLAKSDNSFISS